MDAVLRGKCRVALARRLWSACEGNQRRADKAFLQASLHDLVRAMRDPAPRSSEILLL